jgi:hypothetical protein
LDSIWWQRWSSQKTTFCVIFPAAICWLAGMSESRKLWSLKAKD